MIVIIESPFAGATEEILARNMKYLRACMRHSLLNGESPYASHALYTQPGVLDDTIPHEREIGIRAGFEFREHADLTAIYQDLGVSGGMEYGIKHANTIGTPVEYRSLGTGTMIKLGLL